MSANKKTILTICPSWPGQFKSVINMCSADYNIVAVCQVAKPEYIYQRENITILHDLPFKVGDFYQNAVHFTTGIIRIKEHLKGLGLKPDIVLIQAGFGLEILSQTMFNDIPVIGYFEWYEQDPANPSPETQSVIMHPANMILNTISSDFAHRCSALIVPTRFQRQQFPLELRKRMLVIHEGIDTHFFQPRRDIVEHIDNQFTITYVCRGLEPMRCVMQFFNIVKLVMLEKPNVVVKVIGEDKSFYGGDSQISYKAEAVSLLGSDLSKRVTFLGVVSKEGVRDLLQSSDLHIYFAQPRGISWSVLEALSCGCVTMISDLEGLKEVIQPSHCIPINHDHYQTAKDKVMNVIHDPDSFKNMRNNARQFVLDNFNAESGGSTWKSIVASLI